MRISEHSANLDLSRKVYQQLLHTGGPFDEIQKRDEASRRGSIARDEASPEKSRMKHNRHSETASSSFKHTLHCAFSMKHRQPQTPNNLTKKIVGLSSKGFEATCYTIDKRAKARKKF